MKELLGIFLMIIVSLFGFLYYICIAVEQYLENGYNIITLLMTIPIGIFLLLLIIIVVAVADEGKK